eukprot:COSAG02_NODE_4925_length_4831_cov_2.178149_3_plen_84_part_00
MSEPSVVALVIPATKRRKECRQDGKRTVSASERQIGCPLCLSQGNPQCQSDLRVHSEPCGNAIYDYAQQMLTNNQLPRAPSMS